MPHAWSLWRVEIEVHALSGRQHVRLGDRPTFADVATQEENGGAGRVKCVNRPPHDIALSNSNPRRFKGSDNCTGMRALVVTPHYDQHLLEYMGIHGLA